jgi:hypothetical protein
MVIQGAVIPAAEIETTLDLLRNRHRVHLRPSDRIQLTGMVSHGEATVTLTLSNPDETEVLSVEARCDLVENDIQNPMDGKDICFNLLDMGLGEYLVSGRQWRPPIDWSREVLDDIIVWIRGSVRNVQVDRLTDAFLAEHEG